MPEPADAEPGKPSCLFLHTHIYVLWWNKNSVLRKQQTSSARSSVYTTRRIYLLKSFRHSLAVGFWKSKIQIMMQKFDSSRKLHYHPFSLTSPRIGSQPGDFKATFWRCALTSMRCDDERHGRFSPCRYSCSNRSTKSRSKSSLIYTRSTVLNLANTRSQYMPPLYLVFSGLRCLLTLLLCLANLRRASLHTSLPSYNI